MSLPRAISALTIERLAQDYARFFRIEPNLDFDNNSWEIAAGF
jgi:hypothetical protein